MAPRYKEDILRERFRRSVAGGSIADHSSLQEALDGDEPASSAFSQASVQYHASDDFRRLIDELGSIISRSAAQPEHELDKELGTRPFTPPEPQRAQTATVPPTALPRRRLLTELLHRWRNEAGQAGREIKRIVVAYEAGRDGFWLARWLQARDVEVYVIHPTSIAVSREHRRAKTDRLDTELLMRAFLGWLRGEKRHCSMVAIPTIEEEDARRPSRERQNLVSEQTRIVNQMKAIFARFGILTFRPTLRKT